MSELRVDERACPFCAETVKAVAIVCKHCGRDLPAAVSGAAGFAGVDRQQLDRLRALGISRAQDRWVWRGNYFSQLEQAIQYAEAKGDSVREHKPVPFREPARFKWWMWPVLVGGLFVVFAVLYTPSPETEAKWRAREAIQLCWKEQERKSHSAAAAQFVAGACERMEEDFRTKYGVSP